MTTYPTPFNLTKTLTFTTLTIAFFIISEQLHGNFSVAGADFQSAGNLMQLVPVYLDPGASNNMLINIHGLSEAPLGFQTAEYKL